MAEEKKSYAVNDTLFAEGHLATSLFFIKKGVVSIRKQNGEASSEVGKASAGQVIGELSFFDQGRRTETAVALSYVEVLEIPYSTLNEIYGKVPDYMKSIMACMAARVQSANELIQKLQLAKSSKRA